MAAAPANGVADMDSSNAAPNVEGSHVDVADSSAPTDQATQWGTLQRVIGQRPQQQGGSACRRTELLLCISRALLLQPWCRPDCMVRPGPQVVVAALTVLGPSRVIDPQRRAAFCGC